MTTIIKSSGYSGPVAGLKSISDYDLFPSQKLLGLYEFREGAGTVLTDTSGNGNDGVITPGNGRWIAEGTGWSYQFDGLITSIDLPFSAAADITLVAVCKPVFLAGNNTYRVLVSNLAGTGKGVALCYYSLGGGGTSVVYGTASGLATRIIAPPDVAVEEPWRQEVISLGADGALSLANMTSGGLNTAAIAGYVASSGLLCIGNNRSHAGIGSAQPFNGRIAAVAVYGRKLATLASATNPSGPSEFVKVKNFTNSDILVGRGISI